MKIGNEIRGAYNTDNPRSDHAMKVLRKVASYGMLGMPAQEMNFTVRDKLNAFDYIEIYPAPSHGWYKTHKEGRVVDFAYITPKGRQALLER